MESLTEERLKELEKLMAIQAEHIKELETMLIPVLLPEPPKQNVQGEALQTTSSTPLESWIDNSINKVDNNLALLVNLKARIQL